jgi:hypothetical protein
VAPSAAIVVVRRVKGSSVEPGEAAAKALDPAIVNAAPRTPSIIAILRRDIPVCFNIMVSYR